MMIIAPIFVLGSLYHVRYRVTQIDPEMVLVIS